jgi:hypothetical protein
MYSEYAGSGKAPGPTNVPRLSAKSSGQPSGDAMAEQDTPAPDSARWWYAMSAAFGAAAAPL